MASGSMIWYGMACVSSSGRISLLLGGLRTARALREAEGEGSDRRPRDGDRRHLSPRLGSGRKDITAFEVNPVMADLARAI